MLIGLPCDENSSFLRGPAEAPAAIRQALHDGATNWFSESGVDLFEHPGWLDAGDVPVSLSQPGQAEPASESTGLPVQLAEIEASITALIEKGGRPLCLGGDHAVTYPVLRALGPRYPSLTILHIDAHPDLYEVFEGNRYSHACPFARIIEEGLAGRLVQVGLRTVTSHQRHQARRFGVTQVDMKDWRPDMDLGLGAPIYLSLDLDGLDPAFAPGVSHPEAGGLSSREVIDLIHRLPIPLVGADLVELNPPRDPLGLTARLAVKLVKEILAKMLES